MRREAVGLVMRRAAPVLAVVLLECSSDKPTPPAKPPPPPAADKPDRTAWWCYSGQHPAAAAPGSLCKRSEGECNSTLAQLRDEGFQPDAPQCINHDRAYCLTAPSGAEQCVATPDHCERTRRVYGSDVQCRELP
jgi:hypothetical protein